MCNCEVTCDGIVHYSPGRVYNPSIHTLFNRAPLLYFRKTDSVMTVQVFFMMRIFLFLWSNGGTNNQNKLKNIASSREDFMKKMSITLTLIHLGSIEVYIHDKTVIVPLLLQQLFHSFASMENKWLMSFTKKWYENIDEIYRNTSCVKITLK